jgi:hypothetical protein
MPTSNKSGPSGHKNNASSKQKGNGARGAPPAAKAKAPVAAAPPPPPQPIAPAVTRRNVPAASRAKAKAAFANFTLSKYGQGPTPANHVAPGQSAAAVQRDAMASQVEQMPLNGAISIALPAAQLKALLPSYDPSTGTVSLDDVVNALEQNMRGHEFFANGNPTLNRLAVQSQVDDIIASALKGGSQ